MGTEIERKFLVTPASTIPPGVATALQQGYLAVGDDGRETRLRRQDDAYTLTSKRGSGLVRQEWETRLTAEQFDALWPATEGARLEKTRHRVPIAGGTALADVYHGELTGLRVVEVEFEDVEQATRFEPPDWFGPEVTGRHEYKNQYLTTLRAEAAAALLAHRS
ncbi:adenylate cyclase [Streptomyces sp. NPDC093089]|uniref:adenylate cyclase n=1 Tax=Streptomyces sp. NPDC093089 TaxID=3366024 RepID=UPI00380E057B